MDLLVVLQPFWEFLGKFFSVTITLGGFSFSVGALFMWCILASILIAFMKGLTG